MTEFIKTKKSTKIYVSKIKGTDEVLLESLINFYSKDSQYLNILSKISKQKTIISLREIDYTVTNYSNNNKIRYKLKDNTVFNMYLNYKNELRGYSKKCFDPFCRGKRIFVSYDNLFVKYLNSEEEIEEHKNNKTGISTTIGQLNFFRWAILNGVIDFCFDNKESIDTEMDDVSNKKLLKTSQLLLSNINLSNGNSNNNNNSKNTSNSMVVVLEPV